MFQYVKGDLLKAEAEALVNTVNTVGVMGKGIALQFKEAFPNNNKAYVEACKRKELVPGKMLANWDNNLLLGKKMIINFPTKVHWRNPSRYEWIESGLIALADLINEKKVNSIAIPPLGCGNGGLEWDKVKSLIEKYLGELDAQILVFEPNAEIKQLLQKQELPKEVKLTPARAQLMYALFTYESFGEYSSLFAANKLAYFLQRMGQPLKLQFQTHHYGPYAIGVEKVLYAMNGSFLKGLEQQQVKPFEPLNLNYEKWQEVNDYVEKQMTPDEKNRLHNLIKLIGGYTSELSLEILASVAFILEKNPGFTLQDVNEAIKVWSKRKSLLFKEEYVFDAYAQLKNYQEILVYN